MAQEVNAWHACRLQSGLKYWVELFHYLAVMYNTYLISICNYIILRTWNLACLKPVYCKSIPTSSNQVQSDLLWSLHISSGCHVMKIENLLLKYNWISLSFWETTRLWNESRFKNNDARLVLRRKLNGATTLQTPNWKPRIATVDSCFNLVGSRQHGVAGNEVISWSTDHSNPLMQVVMTSDETQIQIPKWPMSHAKRVAKDIILLAP